MSKNLEYLFLEPDNNGEKWENTFFKLLENKNRKEFREFLKTAKHLYLNETLIRSFISHFTQTPDKHELINLVKNLSNQDDLIENINVTLIITISHYNTKCIVPTVEVKEITCNSNSIEQAIPSDDDIQKVTIKTKSASLETTYGSVINVTKLSEYKKLHHLMQNYPELETTERKGRCHIKSVEIAKLLDFPCNVVTGYIFGVSDKSKLLHSWIETTLNKKPVVLDYTLNAIMPLTDYYFMRSPQILSSVTNEQLKSDEKFLTNYIGEHLTYKEYLTFRNEFIKDLQKNSALFEQEK